MTRRRSRWNGHSGRKSSPTSASSSAPSGASPQRMVLPPPPETLPEKSALLLELVRDYITSPQVQQRLGRMDGVEQALVASDSLTSLVCGTVAYVLAATSETQEELVGRLDRVLSQMREMILTGVEELRAMVAAKEAQAQAQVEGVEQVEKVEEEPHAD